jgi:hypothetical protein
MIRGMGSYLLNDRLLRPSPNGRFPRSFHLHRSRYARETIVEIGSLGVALATTLIQEIGSP